MIVLPRSTSARVSARREFWFHAGGPMK